MGDAVGVAGEARVGPQVGRAQGGAQLAELAVVAHGDDDGAVAAREGLVGGEVGVGVAHARRGDAGDEEVGRLVGQHGRLDVEQGDVDVLALAGGAGVQQGGEDGVGRVQAGEQVDHGDPDLHRFGPGGAVRLAGDRHQPAHGLDHVVIAGLGRARAGLAEAGDGAVDQPRVDRRQAGVVEAVLLQPADLEVLDHHVAVGGEAAHGGGPLGRGDVQRHGLLAAVGAQEIGGVAGAPVGAGGEGRAPLAGVVAGPRPLDLDHLGPEVGEGLGRPRSGEDAGQVEDAYAGEGALGHVPRLARPDELGKGRAATSL